MLGKKIYIKYFERAIEMEYIHRVNTNGFDSTFGEKKAEEMLRLGSDIAPFLHSHFTALLEAVLSITPSLE